MPYHSIALSVAVLLAISCNRRTTPEPDMHSAPDIAPATPRATQPTAVSSPGAATDNIAPSDGNGMAASNGNGMAASRGNGMASANSKAAPLTDEQIALITEDANSAEIAQAKLADQKAKDPRVKNFASMMVKHHSEAKNQQTKLNLKTATSPVSMDLEKSAANTQSTLTSASGRAFDTAYMNAQVEEHQKVLDTINQALLPSVKNKDLKSYLDEVKSTVENHLKEAQRIQHTLTETASTAK
jgi:putative membrane protein